MPTQQNRDENMGAATLNNIPRNALPASDFGFSPRAPSLGIEGQSNRARSQASVAKLGEYPMVCSVLPSITAILSVLMGSVT